MKPPAHVIETRPLTPDRWRDFAAIMNARYDTRHCWCMWPRLATGYRTRTGAANRRSIKKAVDTAPAPPGVLAYVDGEVAGWCAVAPREDYPRLDRSGVTARVDDKPVWSVVCFTVLRPLRGKGLTRRLLAAAVELARAHGATIVEGYPVEGGGDAFHGISSVFEAGGFTEVARRKPNRPYMRRTTRPSTTRPSRKGAARR
jgi:GNAT superfamily N-acetyltransferase